MIVHRKIELPSPCGGSVVIMWTVHPESDQSIRAAMPEIEAIFQSAMDKVAHLKESPSALREKPCTGCGG